MTITDRNGPRERKSRKTTSGKTFGLLASDKQLSQFLTLHPAFSDLGPISLTDQQLVVGFFDACDRLHWPAFRPVKETSVKQKMILPTPKGEKGEKDRLYSKH